MRLRLATILAAASIAPGAACSDDDSSPTGRADAAVAAGDFERFRRSSAAGLCPGDMDCASFIELGADRVLLFDRFGELPVVVHQAEVTPGELADAVLVLTDPDLVALLDLGEPPCLPPSDVFEQMLLVAGGREHANDTTFCDDAPLEAARAALEDLAAAHFPSSALAPLDLRR